MTAGTASAVRDAEPGGPGRLSRAQHLASLAAGLPILRAVSGERPVALTESLVTNEVDGELVVRDAERGLTCRLNACAAVVWKACDGSRTPDDLVDVVAGEFGPHADQDLILLALDDLFEHDLITSGYERRKPSAARQSRRRLLRRLGLAGATPITLPIVYGTAPPVLADSVDARGALADF